MFKKVIKEEFKVPADVNYLGEMRDFITRVGRKYGVAERVINTFKLAIDEAGTNIIRHAYRDWEGFITVRMIVRDKSVTVSMIDQGHAFDPNNVRDPDLQRYVDIGKKGGLGIFILRRVIDEIDYRKTVEGNELRLTKNRKISVRRHFIMPEISITMKTRFSLVASAVLSVFVIATFIWTYLRQDEIIINNELEYWGDLARGVATNCHDHLAKDEPTSWEMARIAAEFQRDYNQSVIDLVVLDDTGIIHGAHRTEHILEEFEQPGQAVLIQEDVYRYSMPSGKTIVDLRVPVLSELPGIPTEIGSIHLLLDQRSIDSKIGSAQRKTIATFGFILVFGYIGVFLLVYVTMSPFKKLANWVRALGRDEAHDEMDFDSTDEVGEIAKAFNEITEKFRKSQENLAEQERLQKEMQVAQEIQQTLLPAAFPEIEGYEIASYYEAAKDVGGDYFDFVEVDKDTLGIVVADVSGKGVPGSLVMTMIRTALRTEARGNRNAANVLARVNDFVMNDMKRGMFVTIFYIILDSHRRTINYASAGHNPMILYRGSTQKSYYLNPRGFPIGINLPDPSLFRKAIQSDTMQFREGDVLLVYTDGITEAMNPKRDRFGDERLLATIRKYGGLKVDPLVDKIKDEINVFTEGFSQSDDITLVAIREKMNAEDVLFNLRSKLMKMVDKGTSVKEACEAVGVSTSTYYKYKKRYKKMGLKGLREKVVRSTIDEKHISIEDKAKIFDIVKSRPEFGAKRISEELNTEKYGNIEIDDKRIYEELVRNRLNTKELRTAFVERGDKGKRMKPPGTPLLTLDGQIIMEPSIYGRSKVKEPLDLPKRQPIYDDDVGGSKGDGIQTEQIPASSLELRDDSKKSDEVSFADILADEDSGAEGDETKSFMNALLDLREVPSDQADQTIDASDDIPSESTLADLGIREIGRKRFKDKDDSKGDRESYIDDWKDGVEYDEMSGDLEDDIEFDLESSSVSDVDALEDIDSILEGVDDISTFSDEDQVEDRITASIADELIGEELGLVDEHDLPSSDESVPNEGFLDEMEKLGFDRKTVLSDRGQDGFDQSKQAARALNRKRFLESGLWFYRQGLYNKAIEEYQKAIAEDTQFTEAYQCLGDTLFRLGRLEEALEAYERVRRLDPENVNVLENLGVIFANRGDYKKAVWQWGEVLKRTPTRVDIIDRIKKMQRVIRQRCL